MFTPFRVLCPAKINRFLSVGPIDERRYHPIRTVFQAISLADELLIQPGTGQVHWEFPDPRIAFEVPARNTVTKALSRLQEIAPLPALDVTVTKRIPTESGLGGGSSNAAGIIRAAEHLVGPLSRAEKMGIAASIGADVPFFLVGGRAYGEGYGDQLTAWPDEPTEAIVIARPEVSCSTPAMYAKLDETVRAWRDYTPGEHYNDFERVAPCECLELMERLEVAGAHSAGLSGSGSAVYGLFENVELAQAAASRLDTYFVWVGETLSRDRSIGTGP